MKKTIYLIFGICITFLCSFLVCFGDTGPKDILVVYVENPPQEKYYLDLLIVKSDDTEIYNNITEEQKETLNKNMISKLYGFEKDGLVPAIVYGTNAPMWGELEGYKQGEKMVHKFGYHGLAQKYKIIVVTQSGNVKVSDTHERKTLASSITLNYETGECKVPPILISQFIQFFSTCIPTIIIEGILLIIFGFKIKENYKIFLFMNILTQGFLTLTLGTILIKSGTIHTYIAILPIEICILLSETIVYSKFLNGKSKIRRISYGIIANLLSLLIGYYFIPQQYGIIINCL